MPKHPPPAQDPAAAPDLPEDNVVSLDEERARREQEAFVQQFTGNVQGLKLPPLSKETQAWLDQFGDMD